ncbi:MAG: alanine--tRNA ligase [Candidatus Paceibacterota bacterium]
MKSSEIRKRFLNFFEKRGHAIIPSYSLVPENDPSVLFTTAGMQPLVPYLLGEKHPKGTRLANIQKCVRTGDIDEIGDNTHATFFEMMGNWSLGDYFKKEAIEWSFEFLTSKEEGLGLDPQRLYVTCFEGDENAPRDDESYKIWKGIFEKNNIKGERIYFRPADKNWWSPGDNGPCGPDTEMFYDLTGNLTEGMTLEEYLKADDEQKIVEIWNDVFMEYVKKDGKVVGKLESKNVDTGSGFERVVAVMQGKDNIFDTDLFLPIMEVSKTLTDSLKSQRIISDHIRASIFMISDGVLPSNTDQGYILRRLIRRFVFNTKNRKLEKKEIDKIVDVVISVYGDVYENIKNKRDDIIEEINKESEKFSEALISSKSLFEKIMANQYEDGRVVESVERSKISGKTAFDLLQNHGIPLELTIEIAKENNLEVDINSFKAEMKKHQELSRAGAEQKFKGGLGGHGEMEIKYHTATHLLHKALRDVLGDHISQKGSNITAERLRFDFSHSEKMTDEQKREVEEIVNQKIKENLPVNKMVMKKEDALKTGALHFFGDKYGDEVNVYFIGDSINTAYSKEFCGGPHVENTSVLGKFKILKEEGISTGVRRIKAVLE